MQEVVAPLPTLVVGLTLGNLIFVVWECQVDAPRVDVQMTSKHRAAGPGTVDRLRLLLNHPNLLLELHPPAQVFPFCLWIPRLHMLPTIRLPKRVCL